MSESKSMILGCSGRKLTADERHFYRDERPWGFILFARNISEPNQIRDLVADMRDCTGRDDAPVLIDQEGGRVQRLKPPLAQSYPPGSALGALYRSNEEAGLRAAWLMSRLHAFDLRRYDIDVDCLPVLDVPVEGASEVIGARAYDREPEIVARIGRAAADGLLAGGVLPVMKHMPGHGRADADTHFELPIVKARRDDLSARDFAPFAALVDLPMAMTAHVIYASIDPEQPATTSARVVEEVIRGEIGFHGVLMSDDLSMKALSGNFADRAMAVLEAGVDMVLHCNGDMDEMRAVASRVTELEGPSLARADRALAGRRAPSDDDEEALREEFASHLLVA